MGCGPLRSRHRRLEALPEALRLQLSMEEACCQSQLVGQRVAFFSNGVGFIEELRDWMQDAIEVYSGQRKPCRGSVANKSRNRGHVLQYCHQNGENLTDPGR